jgi:hypothetical protein
MAKSESLADLARASVGTKGPRAAVEILAARLAKEDPKLRAEFVAAINDRSVPAAGLSRALKARGIDMPEGSISRWRLNNGELS